MNYSVSSSSPTDELLTVGSILSEVGEYASTVLDLEHLSLSRKCMTKLGKVVGELVSRRSIKTVDNLYDVPQSASVVTDLAALSIDELYNLYRSWPLRHKEREAKGREPFTFYYESRIVKELQNRKTIDNAEQFKIDYCVTTHRNELDNMSFVFSCTVQLSNDKIYPDPNRDYDLDELIALVRLYRDFRDITEREILVEYVDKALDWLKMNLVGLEKNKVAESGLALLAELAELGCRNKIRIPGWVNQRLEDAIIRSLKSTEKPYELAPAMLTLQMINKDELLERKAKRLINRCYKSAFDDSLELGGRIGNLYTAVTCCEYVSRFSVRKVATLWNELSSRISSENGSGCQALSGNGFKGRPLSEKEADSRELFSHKEVTSKNIFQLLEIADICGSYASISAELKEALKYSLNEMAQGDDAGAKAYNQIVK